MLFQNQQYVYLGLNQEQIALNPNPNIKHKYVEFILLQLNNQLNLQMKAGFQQLKNHLSLQNKNIYLISGVLGVGVAALAAYKFFIANKQKNDPKTPIEQDKSFEQTYKEVIKSVQEIISRYKILNGQVIKCIIKNQYKLAQEDYMIFIIKMRNQRRKSMKDKHQYGRDVLTIDVALEQLMDKHLNAILAHFNIDKTFWIQTVELWSTQSEQNREEWENLLVQLDNQQIDSLRDTTKKPMPFKKLQQIIRFKIFSLQHLNQSGLDLDSSTTSEDQTDLNDKYTLIDKYIQDLVFKKYAVEQEDINFSESKLSQSQNDKFAQISDEYTEIIRIQIFGDQSIDDEQGQRQDTRKQDLEKEQYNDEDPVQQITQKNVPKPSTQKDQPNLNEQEDEDQGQYF